MQTPFQTSSIIPRKLGDYIQVGPAWELTLGWRQFDGISTGFSEMRQRAFRFVESCDESIPTAVHLARADFGLS
jgi:hypothetical protein